MKNKLWVGLLLMLGFTLTDCQKDMYGTPYIEFEVKGKVIDEAGDPIKGIQVRLFEEERLLHTAQTDAAGEYKIGWNYWDFIEMDATAEDVDGEDNGGEFVSQTIPIAAESWDYTGVKAKKTVNFTLEKTTSEDTEQDE